MNRLALLCLFAAVASVTSTASASSSESAESVPSECRVSQCTTLFEQKKVLKGGLREIFTNVTTVEDCCEKHCVPVVGCAGVGHSTTATGFKLCKTYDYIESLAYDAYSDVIWCTYEEVTK